VLRGFTADPLSRATAALLILTLSGAVGVAPRARAAEHQCHCHGMMVDGHHVCSCPICRLAGLRATARDRAASPERRLAAMKALNEAMARPENGGAPCCSSRCDDSDTIPGVRPGTEPFTLPKSLTLFRSAMLVEHGDFVGRPVTRDSLPEIPPPRSPWS